MGIGIPARRFPGILQELESFTASDMDGIGILQYGGDAIFQNDNRTSSAPNSLNSGKEAYRDSSYDQKQHRTICISCIVGMRGPIST
jgi:hypothetical protein